MTEVKIKGVSHEFSAVSGVLEDVMVILLNLKKLRFKIFEGESAVVELKVKGEKEIKGVDFKITPNIELANPEVHIATITDKKTELDIEIKIEKGIGYEPRDRRKIKKAEIGTIYLDAIYTPIKNVNFNIEMEVKKGRGYVTAEENEPEEQEIGLIAVDSIFSPIRNVRYTVEETRVGRRTNYDKLSMEIWTNGIVSPEMALVEAAKIMRKHMNPFVQYFEIGRELQQLEKRMGVESFAEISEEELHNKFSMPIAELDLSVRASNCLETANINTVGDLVAKAEEQLLAIKNFGKTTLKEVKKKLAQLNLTIGMPVPVKQMEKGKG